MKCLLPFFTVIFLLVSGSNCYGQPNRDSTALRTIRVMQARLNLSDAQVGAVLTLVKKQHNQLDKLQQNRTIQIEERGKDLVKIQNEYELRLKNVFTKSQWKEYKNIEAANRESTLNSIKDRKNELKELPRNAN